MTDKERVYMEIMQRYGADSIEDLIMSIMEPNCLYTTGMPYRKAEKIAHSFVREVYKGKASLERMTASEQTSTPSDDD